MRSTPRRWAVAAGLLALAPLAGAETPDPPDFAPAPRGPVAASMMKGPPDPSAPRPFEEVLRGATRDAGLLPIWRKDDKVWIEIPKEMFGKPFLFTANVANSVGERGLYASQMGVNELTEFRLVGRQVQLLAINTLYRAVADQGSKRAIDQAFSPSLLASATIASAEHPVRKSQLVEANFLFNDIPAYSTRLEAAYRMSFGIDRTNSSFERVRADPGLTTLTTRIHFYTPRIPVPVPGMPSFASPPNATPDPRSLFVDFVYSFLALPDQPMPARAADPRIGHFTESFTDLGGDAKANPRTHYVTRWRLEKKDPAAALSEPVKPIVFWMDKNIPARYRPTIEAGILEWNRAFERIGYKNAIVVQQQPDDADWDNMDAGHASVRWFVSADSGFAIGPRHTDPRTGEILDADIAVSDMFARGYRRTFVEEVGTRASSEANLAALTAHWRNGGVHGAQCDDAHMTATETMFALELLEARDELSADSPEAEAFVLGALKGTIMHEVGHVLGLKHNFKGSTVLSAAQLQDKAFTEANGIGNSVMEYAPVNLALAGEKQGSYHRTALGAYDMWAIEYAYKPIEAGREAQELAAIAGRSTDPALAYADDTDAGGYGGGEGIDPLAARYDLTDDPLAWFRKRMKLSQELWSRIQQREPRAGEDPLRQRRAVMAGFVPLGTIADLSARYVGGMHATRDLPGSRRPAFRPVESVRQREALQFLASNVFSAESFRFQPHLLSSMRVDYSEWVRGGPADIASAVGRVQSAALNRLMSAGTASRLIDLPNYLPAADRKDVISLNEVYDTLQRSIWSELATGADIDRLRRNLQREHVRRLSAVLTRGGLGLPPDAVSLLRYHATQLETRMRAAVARNHQSVEVKAHLAESLSILQESLKATMQRS
jgi:hypothetical protein